MLLAVAATVPLSPEPAGAQDDGLTACPADLDDVAAGDSVVRVVKVAGLIDSVVANHLLAELATAEEDDANALVIWLNSNGSVLDGPEYLELATALAESPLTTAAWVGQSGSTALGGAAELLGMVDIVGVSPGSTIGSTGEARLPDRFPPAFGDATERLETATIGAEEAVRLGISVGPLADVATIGPFLTQVPGYETFRCLDAETETPRTIPITRTELSGLPITAQLFHTVASPEVAYLLFAIGLGLLVFELFTAGVGIAGVLGAGFLALGSYGLASLPTRWWAIGLLLVAMVFIAVDVQTNVPRLYTAAGIAVFVAGTFLLYDGVSMSWVTIISGIVGVILYAYAGMPSMVRTRFSTPTIGRRWMIGQTGEAVTDVAPEGTVRIGDASWRAVTNRATPVKAGDPVRVVGLDRLLLEIEPEEGGAKDYRERR
ncbi:MAG: nodulation protein NfeD [Acidimicrobiales bacterium]